ncbi:MAG: hypothetical protein ACJAUL_002809 [Paraglaciecola sp.]|jgi:hypothetical protein
MALLLLLIMTHVVGDFYVQRRAWITCRNTNHLLSMGLLKNFISHVLLLVMVLWLSGHMTLKGALVITLVSLTQLLINLWKSYQVENLYYFMLDQLLHLTVLVLAWVVLSGFSLSQIMAQVGLLVDDKFIAIAVAYIVACKPASMTISIGLKGLTEQLNSNQAGLVSAGRWIGYLERCLIISFVLIGQFAGVGFLLAAKTIFRFGDLTKEQDMKLTEYMMLGTLLSFSCALLLGWLVNKSVF